MPDPLVRQLLTAETELGPRLHFEPLGRDRSLTLRAQTKCSGAESLDQSKASGQHDVRQHVAGQEFLGPRVGFHQLVPDRMRHRGVV